MLTKRNYCSDTLSNIIWEDNHIFVNKDTKIINSAAVLPALYKISTSTTALMLVLESNCFATKCAEMLV